MRKLIADEWLSLDGVAQAPSYPDEDNDDGFSHGGWHTRYLDDMSMSWVIGNIASAGAYVFGRRTYDVFAAHWPSASDEEEVLAQPLNHRPKHVASRTLTGPLEWQNSQLLGDDVPTAVAALKQADGDDLHLIGSTQLLQTLIEHDLIDEYRLMIDPVILGSGKRLFRNHDQLHCLRLLETQVTPTGAILATYAQAGR